MPVRGNACEIYETIASRATTEKTSEKLWLMSAHAVPHNIRPGHAIYWDHTVRLLHSNTGGANPLQRIFGHYQDHTMKKATHADAVLIARSMNMKVDVVWDIIGGMNYNSYSELVMAVLICLKPLPIERLSSPGK
jgi:hypothetical protein